MAVHFLECPSEKHIYATWIDGDKENCRLENIKWITAKENSERAWEKRIENGTTGAGEKRKKVQKNIVVDSYKTQIENGEKPVIINEEETPFVVREDGRIRNLKTGNILKGSNLHSYQYINFRWNNKQLNRSVHQIVAQSFLENPNNYTIVDHIDGDRLNNNVKNLRWVSVKTNSNNRHLEKTPISVIKRLYIAKRN